MGYDETLPEDIMVGMAEMDIKSAATDLSRFGWTSEQIKELVDIALEGE